MKISQEEIFYRALDLDLHKFTTDFIKRNGIKDNTDSSLPDKCFNIVLEKSKELTSNPKPDYYQLKDLDPEMPKDFLEQAGKLIIDQPEFYCSPQLFNELIIEYKLSMLI